MHELGRCPAIFDSFAGKAQDPRQCRNDAPCNQHFYQADKKVQDALPLPKWFVAAKDVENLLVGLKQWKERHDALENRIFEFKAKWTPLPDEQGWWWHWSSENDAEPFIYSIMWSGTANRFFIAYPDSRWCEDVGGVWTKVMLPERVLAGDAAPKQ